MCTFHLIKGFKKAQSEPPKPLVDSLFEEILAQTKTIGTLQDENLESAAGRRKS